MTDTFKLKKHQLMREGFDPIRLRELVYIRHPGSGGYRLLDAARLFRNRSWRDPLLALKPSIQTSPRRQAFNVLALLV